MRWILCSLLLTLTQHSFCSPWMKESFWLSSLIREEAHFLRPQLPQTVTDLVGLGRVNCKPPAGSHNPRCHWEHSWFMGRGQISTPRGLWKKQIPTVMDDSESFKISEKEMTTDVVNSQKTRLGMEPELLQSCDNTWVDEELLLMDEQRKRFQESTPGEEVTKTVKITTFRGLRILHKLSWQRSRVWEDSFRFWKMFYCGQNAVNAMEKLFRKGRVDPWGRCYCSIFRKSHGHPNLDHPGLVSQQPSTRAQPSTSKKITAHWRIGWWLAFLKYGHFSDTVLLHTSQTTVYIKT